MIQQHMTAVPHSAPPASPPSHQMTISRRTRLWQCLDPGRQQQVAQLLADLIRRMYQQPHPTKDSNHESHHT